MDRLAVSPCIRNVGPGKVTRIKSSSLPEQGEMEEFRKSFKVPKSLENYGLVRFDSKYNPWSLEWNVAVDWEG